MQETISACGGLMKLRTIFFIMATALMVSAGAGIIWMVNTEMRQQALQEAESKARILLDRNLATHTYFSHRLKPELFEWSEEFRDPEHFAPVWMSSTYAVRKMQSYFKDLNQNDHYYKECAINARSPENEADGYEQKFLEKLNKNEDLTAKSGIRNIDGRPYFYVLRRGETMEESCLRCHSAPEAAPAEMVAKYGPERSFDREADEVVSAVSIRIPLESAFANANRISLYISGVMVFILAGVFSAILWFTRRFLFSPIDRIREKSRQFTESGAGLGETMELPRGRELRELTETFNSMSIQLGMHMEELEERVRSRTLELSEKNRQLEKAVAEKERTAYLLEQSEHKYRSMMEGMPDAVYICNPDYTIAYMNQAMISRIGRDATGESCHLAIHGLEEKCTWCAFESVKNENYEGNEIKSPLDGRIYNITHSPIKNMDGSVSKLSIYRDVTEMRNLEARVFNVRKFETIAVMAGGIAHDFNNLMSVILGYISMVEQSEIPEKYRHMIENAQSACNQAKQLTHRLMILTRSAEPEKVSGDIAKTLKYTVDSALQNCPLVRSEVDLPDSPVHAAFDAEQIKLALSEIIENAKEAMPDGGLLRVTTQTLHFPQDEDTPADPRVPGSYIRIRIEDSGRGIQVSDLEKIFDPYFTTKEMGPVKGMGLGLSTAYSVINKHGGRIRLESEPEKGTSVIIDLPAESQ